MAGAVTVEMDWRKADPQILRILAISVLDGQQARHWLHDPRVDTVRKACLLNILAALCVTPPLIAQVVYVFTVRTDRIHALCHADIRQTLGVLSADPRLPFYHDRREPSRIHREVLDNFPELADSDLTSYRGEGNPSLQLVVANSYLDRTVADIDLDLYNPIQDVVGFVGHMKEVVHNRRRKTVTNHLAIYRSLSNGPAAPFLCYTLEPVVRVVA